MYTEFTSADGIVLANDEGKMKLLRKFLYSEIERPIVAQIFSSVPEHIEKVSALIAEMGFDGVDINMGCPDRSVEKSGCGAALIKTPALARELIRAAKRGAPNLPVSLKTRLGYNTDELETWLPELLAEEPAAIAIHARTRKEMSEVPARWERIARAVEIRNELKSSTLILGNGDVKDITDARAKAAATNCDGVMLGRTIFGNPWLFANLRNLASSSAPTPKQRIEVLLEHLALFDELLSDVTNYAVMKKHFKAYISGWDNAKELRVRLMETENSNHARTILGEQLGSLSIS